MLPMKYFRDVNDINRVHYKPALDLNTDLSLKAATDMLTDSSELTRSSRKKYFF